MNKSTGILELTILSGVQAGAKISLEGKASVLIGGDYENDIVLRDDVLQGQQLELLIDGSSVSLNVISGTVRLLKGYYHTGQQIELKPFSPVKVGESIFAFGVRGSKRWNKVPTTFPKVKQQSAADQAVIAEKKAAAAQQQATMLAQDKEGKAPLTFLRLALTAHVLMVVVGISVVYFKPQETEGSIDQDLYRLSDYLQGEEYQQVNLTRNSQGILTVTGYLENKSDSIRLEDFLTGMDLYTEVSLEVGGELANAVKDIYRLNEVDAVVELLERGVVRVSTTEGDLKKLKKVEKIAYQDLPGLQSLKSNNHPPDIQPEQKAKKIARKKLIESFKSSQIVMIAAGPNAYIMTEDRSRYHLGSVLPGGYKVARILADKIVLTREGKRTVVKF